MQLSTQLVSGQEQIKEVSRPHVSGGQTQTGRSLAERHGLGAREVEVAVAARPLPERAVHDRAQLLLLVQRNEVADDVIDRHLGGSGRQLGRLRGWGRCATLGRECEAFG